MVRTRIKICGLTRSEDVQVTIRLGADAIGFVFYPKSPRYVSIEKASALIEQIPPFVNTVGLFVNASAEEVAATVKQVPLSLLQFHGDETIVECCRSAALANRPFIRAIRIKPDTAASDLLQCLQDYRAASPLFAGLLLDTFVDGYGGAGKVFDWSLIPKELAAQVVLSGGLNVQNVTDAVRHVRPFAVDVSSGVELKKGIKDADKIGAFIQAVRQADSVISHE